MLIYCVISHVTDQQITTLIGIKVSVSIMYDHITDNEKKLNETNDFVVGGSWVA